MYTMYWKGGSEGGGESDDLLNGDCSPKEPDIKEEQLPSSHIEQKPAPEEYIQEHLLTDPIQLSVQDQDEILEEAQLDVDVQQKLLAEIPFKMEDKEDAVDMKDAEISSICIPYADSTTSQPENISYLSKLRITFVYLRIPTLVLPALLIFVNSDYFCVIFRIERFFFCGCFVVITILLLLFYYNVDDYGKKARNICADMRL